DGAVYLRVGALGGSMQLHRGAWAGGSEYAAAPPAGGCGHARHHRVYLRFSSVFGGTPSANEYGTQNIYPKQCCRCSACGSWSVRAADVRCRSWESCKASKNKEIPKVRNGSGRRYGPGKVPPSERAGLRRGGIGFSQ